MPDEILLGLSEAAEMLGVTRQTVTNWRVRRDDFPEPMADLKSGPVWAASQIIAWAAENDVEVREVLADGPNNQPPVPVTTVSIVNMKGGVGKSTLTANLGWFYAYKQNLKVLLVDLDPQFNLSQYALGTQGYQDHINANKGTVLSIFEQATPSVVSGRSKTSLDPRSVIAHVKAWSDGSRLDLVPSQLELAWTLKNPHQKEHLLAQFLDEVRPDYDLVLIDCPPTDSMLTTAAYLASDSVLVPVRPEYLSTIGLPLLVRSIEDFHDSYKGRKLDVLGVVFNASNDSPEHDRSRSDVRRVAKQNGWYVFRSEVSFSDSYPKGSRLGQPIFLTEHARYWKIEDFFQVANEFQTRINP